MKFFVTGTDTNVGKTIVSTILCNSLKASYFKPIQSGISEGIDSDIIKKFTSSKIIPETYKLIQPLSPHLAAKHDNIDIDIDKIDLPKEEKLIVEGAGGLMVPINQKYMMIDLIKKLNIPVILVARTTLGTINHTLMSVKILRNYNIRIHGIVLNGKKMIDIKESIEFYSGVKIIYELEYVEEISKKWITSNVIKI
jgi:dethiobiotin synthetase